MMTVLWGSMVFRFSTMFVAWGIVIAVFFAIMRLYERYAAQDMAEFEHEHNMGTVGDDSPEYRSMDTHPTGLGTDDIAQKHDTG